MVEVVDSCVQVEEFLRSFPPLESLLLSWPKQHLPGLAAAVPDAV